MADLLLIHFNPEQADNCSWSLVNNAGELTTMLSHGSLGDATSIAENHKTIVLLDSTNIHIDSVKLPVKNPQKLLRAVPFALEEHLADDIDELHFITGKTGSDGKTPVVAIRRHTLNNILELFQQANIKPFAIIPDALCLTANPAQWAILLQDNQAKVQFDHFDAGDFDREALPLLLKSELQNTDRQATEKIILYTIDGDTSETEDINESIPEQIELVRVSYNTDPLVIYCGQYKHALSLNLLQNDYKPKSKANINWQRWRFAAALSTLALCLHLGLAGTQYSELQDKNKKLQVAIDNIYKKTFPQSKRIVNARVQMEQKLDELKGLGKVSSKTSLITMLSDSSAALSSEKSITLQSINYRNNKIDIEVTGSKLQDIEQLNKKLNKASLNAEIITSSSEKDQVKGNIRIKRANQS